MLQCYSSRWVTTYMSDNYIKAYMSDLRFSCFFGRMICTECESLVSGIGCFMMHIARATLPTFFTCSFFKSILDTENLCSTCISFRSHKETMSTFSGKYDGSQTTFLHFAVSPSEVTPYALPLSSNSTCKPLASLPKSSEDQHLI